MNAKKLFGLALVALLTLVVLVGVAGAGFRMGVMQGASGNSSFPFGRMGGFDQDPRMMQGWNQGNGQGDGQNQGALPNGHPPVQGFDKGYGNGYGNSQMQGFGQGRGFDGGFGRGGFNRRGGGHGDFFGIFHLVLLGVLGWFGYKYAVKSGWRIVRVAPTETATAPAPSAPVEDEIPSEDNPQI